MNKTRWQTAAVACGGVFCAFSAAHPIDEFMWQAPAEFHLPEPTPVLMALGYMLAVVGLLAQAARGRRGGLSGLVIGGTIILAADVVKHVPGVAAPEPWRTGPVSEALVFGLALSSLMLAVACAFSLQIPSRGQSSGRMDVPAGVGESPRSADRGRNSRTAAPRSAAVPGRGVRQAADSTP